MNGLGDLFRLTDYRSRSVCAENPTGEAGKGGMCPLEQGTARDAARDLGTGWKVNPFINVAAGETCTLASIDGPGIINHIWVTPTGAWRSAILRLTVSNTPIRTPPFPPALHR